MLLKILSLGIEKITHMTLLINLHINEVRIRLMKIVLLAQKKVILFGSLLDVIKL
jgi:hypothetical protein